MNCTEVVLRKEGVWRGNYQRCGAEAGIPALSRIFAMLSRDEARHAKALRAMQDGATVELAQSTTAEGAKTLLRRLSVQDAPPLNFHGGQSFFARAMAYEAGNARLCCQLAREALHGWERELLLKIAAEDEMHFTLLEHMRELLLPAFCTEVCDAG